MNEELTTRDSHFAFGKNWADYANDIGASQIAEAEANLRRLLGGADLRGKRFLDVGCGSGIHSLAAVQLGASEVVAFDLDPDSVATTQAVLNRFAGGKRFNVTHASVFDLDQARLGTFDVVYSWGVLHHTGDLDKAVRKTAAMVADNGIFLFALYRRTWMCPFWKWEKKWYSKATTVAQRRARSIYVSLFRLAFWANRRSLDRYISEYKTLRGMDFYHDVHDWLGGYPYESILPEDVKVLMKGIGFSEVRSFLVSTGRKLHGLLGSGCDEYVYRRD